MSYESAGSVRYQIGCSLSEIRDCISAGDLERLADHVRYLVVLSSPYIEREKSGTKDEELRVIVPKEDTQDPENVLFENCMSVLRKLLPLLAKEGLYAFVRGGIGDESALAEEPVEAL